MLTSDQSEPGKLSESLLQKLGLSSMTVIDSACCSPSHLSSIELLVDTRPDLQYVALADNTMDNLEVITIPDLLVTSCGCN